MPVYIALRAIIGGFSSIPYIGVALRFIPLLIVIYVLKRSFSGARNTSERVMHSKVVMITGGTSGIGASIAFELASRGAQIILLTQQPISDPFLVDFIMDLRMSTNNELINAEQVDLSSLHSVRQFGTKWIDNAPPRRLDMVILCADTMTPYGGHVQPTSDGLEPSWQVNYLANFHLLSILSPAIRAQPPDRDVRIIIGTCGSYVRGTLPGTTLPGVPGSTRSKNAYASSKLALMAFSVALQKHFSTYTRPDKHPMNVHTILADPGPSRTPGMRRYLTWGTLHGLALYLIMWPFWWLTLKSAIDGAQSFLYAAMDPGFISLRDAAFVKECRILTANRVEIYDETHQQDLWRYSEQMIEQAEKASALARARAKQKPGGT